MPRHKQTEPEVEEVEADIDAPPEQPTRHWTGPPPVIQPPKNEPTDEE